MKDFKYYNHLGFQNPYYIKEGEYYLFDVDYENILQKQDGKTLDFTSIVQILSTGYAFGDRTILKEIKKSPWMAQPNAANTAWDVFHLKQHQEKRIDAKIIAANFYKLLEEELLEYVTEHDRIGILLTGGMDSRIVASVLSNLLISRRLINKRVTAYTWGALDSRDVVYAKRIADLFDWGWKHVVVDEEQMIKNYQQVIENGCEYTPIHLHAMSKVSDEIDLDCVLAGSFGDSIGRGEYSGIKVNELQSLKLKIKNVSGILRKDFLKIAEAEIDQDLASYHTSFPEEQAYQQHELDMQLHYMRKMLNACMNVINKKIPLYQMFSSPAVFQYIWSIHPECRNDLVYRNLLEMYSPKLLEIPWARTGLPFPETQGEPDKFKKRHHQYGQLLNTKFLGLVEEKIEENKEIASQIFNLKNLKNLIANCKKYPVNNSFTYEEKLLWTAALLEFIKKNEVKIDLPEIPSNNFIETIKHNLRYKVKYFYKKFR